MKEYNLFHINKVLIMLEKKNNIIFFSKKIYKSLKVSMGEISKSKKEKKYNGQKKKDKGQTMI